MQVIEAVALTESLKSTVVALGAFDAIHIGHLEILKKTVECAREHELKSVAYLFKNLPRNVVEGLEIPNVATLEKRLELMGKIGVDIVVVEEFTQEYQKMPYTYFIDEYLFNKFDAKFVCVGYDYRFGFRGEGNSENLKDICESRGVKVEILPCVSLERVVSSTWIRELISDGDVNKAMECMDRPFSIKGMVERGNSQGHKFGFPTANIAFDSRLVAPKYGVYLTSVLYEGEYYPAITNVGMKPTADNNYPCIETHILKFNDDIYGKEIEVFFYEFLRDTKKFDSMEELSLQIDKDKQACREYFKIKP